MKKLCKKCKYKSGDKTSPYCDYIGITGHSRLKLCYDELGVNRLTPTVHAMMRGETCFCFEAKKGSRSAQVHESIKLPDHSQQKAQLREFWEQGCTDNQISEKLHISATTISRWRRDLGLPFNKKPSQFDWEKALRMYKDGKHDPEIAKAIGCSVKGVSSWRCRQGLPGNYI